MDYPAPEKRPGEDLLLDVNLDEPEAEAAVGDDILDVTLDEEPAGVEAYPEVTETQQRASNDVLLECLCSGTKQGFEVRFEEAEPGVYYAAEVTPVAKGKDPTLPTAGKVSGLQQIQGTFRMGPEFACPCCGSRSLSACEACGTTLCAGGTDKTGGCQCPGCGTALTLTNEAATSARGMGGGGKKKRLW
ncbi:MAG: hypothetical protein WCP21_08595 [Armatimonadota bacterium]